MTRAAPNVLVTGTPGTGKTTLCEQVAAATGLRHVNVGDLVKREQLHNGWDDEFECLVIDEDKVCDALEDMMGEGGVLVDYHGCDFFPERWFDLVVVLQTDNTVLWERLEKRAYSQKKIQENVQCEIMHCIVEEATESYRRGRMCAGGAVTMCMACQARGTTCRRTLRLRSARRTTTTSPPLCPPCREEIVHVLQSSTPEDMEQNVEQLTQWARSWRPSS